LPGPTACSGGIALDGSPSALLDQLLAAPVIRCDEVPWSLFGLSMANWNMLISLGMAMTALACLKHHWK
jgi:disulfide bond formation protein DsbB